MRHGRSHHQFKRVMMGIKRKIPLRLLGFAGILTITVLVLHISFSITTLQTNYSIFRNHLSEGVSSLNTIRLNAQNKSIVNILTLTNEIEYPRKDSEKLRIVSHVKTNAELAQPAEDDKTLVELTDSSKDVKANSELTDSVKDKKITTEVLNLVKDIQTSVGSTKSVKDVQTSVGSTKSVKDKKTSVGSTKSVKDKKTTVGSTKSVKDKKTSVGSTKSIKDMTHIKSELAKEDARNSPSVNHATKFVKCDKEKKGVFSFEKDAQKYFEDLGHGVECYIRGTNKTATMEKFKQSRKHRAFTCACLPGYYGKLCSIPSAVWLGSPGNRKFPIRRRSQPRRIINGLPFHHELDMLSARFDEIGDVTDVFIVTESNYTAFGESKPLWLSEKLHQGYASEIQRKIMYILLDWFPKGGRENGWVADEFSRHYLGLWGLPCLEDLHDEDIFVLSDADELPSREVITFLKLHDGFPEPISFSLRWTVFGFFWKQRPDDTYMSERLTTRNSAVTVKTLREFLNSNAYKIRNSQNFDEAPEELGLLTWNIGVPNFYAGWHCSWCFDAQGIAQKLDAAQSDDGPRWGNYQEKKQVPYIEGLVREGRWFDDIGTFAAASSSDPMYAPDYFLRQSDHYRFLLERPEQKVDKEEKTNSKSSDAKVEDKAKEE